MKINWTMTAAGVALLLVALHLAKKKAAAAPASADAVPASAGEWWTYGGMWQVQ